MSEHDPEQPDPEQPDPEQPDPEQPHPEQLGPEQPHPEPLGPEQPDPEQPHPEQLGPEQPAPAADGSLLDEGVWSDEPRRGGSRRRRGRLSGCLPVLAILVVIAVLALVFVPKAIDKVKNQFADPADYPGPGTGSVCFVVNPGDTVTITARNLKAAGVVASVDAFTSAATDASIRDGSYQLKKMMTASDAIAALKNGSRGGCLTQFTIVSGHTVAETITLLAKATGFSTQQLTRAVQDTSKLGLPDYAQGRLEGYLTAGTYQVQKGDKPLSVLKQMVANFTKTADDVGLVDGAAALGYTPEQIVIVASLIQKEVGKPADMAKVARVIYNRLENPGTAGTAGYLQLDSTINYATGKQGFDLGPDDLGVDSPYNTRTHLGLPPGAIDSPGQAALEAALNPTPGDWYYYVTVNPRTQETKFATTYDQFLQDKAEFVQYCQTSDAC